MRGIDWRELYDANQAAIAHARSLTGKTIDPPLSTAVATRLSGARRPYSHRPDPHVSGNRTLVHVPSGLDHSVPSAVVCMLHGCTQDPATFAAATAMNNVADRHGFVVVYPEQQRVRNPQRCWNWFLPKNQRRGCGEPEAIAATLRDVIRHDLRCTIDPTRVFVAGLSSGGAMAMVLAMCYPDLVAAVAVHSGLAYGSATSLKSAYEAMAGAAPNGEAPGHAARAAMGQYARPVPSLVIHGTADRTVAPANALQVLCQSMLANHLAAPDTHDHDISRPTSSRRSHGEDTLPHTVSRWISARGELVHELIEVDGLAHAWSGGAPGGSYTDPRGPSATEAIWNFFSTTTPSLSASKPLPA